MQTKIISQIIDTLKLHAYFPRETVRSEVEKYNSVIDKLSELKKDAQEINNSNNELRFVQTRFYDSNFQVMATTVKGFAVTIKNGDVSISLKRVTLRDSLNNIDDKDKQDNLVPHASKNPVLKVEFRSSFLVRTGYLQALRHIENLVNSELIDNFKPVISEIHIATDIQGYEFTPLDQHRFKTTKNKIANYELNVSSHMYGKQFSGLVYGSGDDMLRIYNKSLEVSIFPDKKYIKDLIWNRNKDYDKSKNVWRIEAQYRRETLKKLKTDCGVIDGYESVLNNIPSLWKRAVEKNKLLNMSDETAIENMTGYKKVNNHQITIMPSSITKRFQRSDTHLAWELIQQFNGYSGEQLDVYEAPRTGARQWVSNSVKTLFSTLLKYNGDITKDAIVEAFKIAEEDTRDLKGLSLVENATLKHVDHFGQSKELRYSGESVFNASNEVENFLPFVAKHLANNINTEVSSEEFYIQLWEKVGY